MVACRYGISLLVFNSTSYSWATSWTLEEKFHIDARPCILLYPPVPGKTSIFKNCSKVLHVKPNTWHMHSISTILQHPMYGFFKTKISWFFSCLHNKIAGKQPLYSKNTNESFKTVFSRKPARWNWSDYWENPVKILNWKIKKRQKGVKSTTWRHINRGACHQPQNEAGNQPTGEFGFWSRVEGRGYKVEGRG